MNGKAMTVLCQEVADHLKAMGDIDDGDVVGAFVITVVFKTPGQTLPEASDSATKLAETVKAKMESLSPDILRIEADGMSLQAMTKEQQAKAKAKTMRQMLEHFGMSESDMPEELKALLNKLGAEDDEPFMDVDEYLDNVKQLVRSSPWGRE